MTKKIFDTYIEQIEKDLLNSKYPKTAKALYRFYLKAISIKTLLEKVTDLNEVYVAKIILRSLFEHLIVAYYIFYRQHNEKDDRVGEEYYQEYLIHEFFKQKGYNQKIDNIKNNKSQNISGLDYLKGQDENLNEITEKQYQEINTIGNKFKVDNILKHLNQADIKSSNILKLHDHMLKFLEEYNKLSSFVHGGPTAEKQTFDDSINLQNEITTIKAWAESLMNTIKEHILIFLMKDNPEYEKLLKPIMDARINNTVPNAYKK